MAMEGNEAHDCDIISPLLRQNTVPPVLLLCYGRLRFAAKVILLYLRISIRIAACIAPI
jgi:hypothetical protein